MRTVLNVEAINKINVNILTGTRIVLDENWRSKMFSSTYSRLYYVKEGDGYLNTSDGTVKLRGGYVYLIPAEFTFSYGCKYLEKIFFHVSVTTMEKYDLFSKIGCICSMPFSKEQYKELSKYLESESYEDLLGVKTIVTQTLFSFLNNTGLQKTPAKKHGDLVKNIIAYIHENIRVNLSVRDISNRLFVSESKIRNTFLKEMEIPVGKYIDDMVFIKAKELLAKEQLSIAEISAELGFCDQFYFSRRFKGKFGETPSHFRKNIPSFI